MDKGTTLIQNKFVFLKDRISTSNHDTVPRKKDIHSLYCLYCWCFCDFIYHKHSQLIIVGVKESFDLFKRRRIIALSFFIAYAVMSIPAGLMTERFRKALLSGSFVVIILSCFSLVLNPNYFYFLVTLFALGLCMAVLQVIINPMLRMLVVKSIYFQFCDGTSSFWVCIIFKSTLVHAFGQ